MGLDAVLFDWGDTLFHFAYDEALLEAGWAAGLQATGRDDLPDHELAAARFREGYLPLLFVPGTVEEVEYPNLIRELLAASTSSSRRTSLHASSRRSTRPGRRRGRWATPPMRSLRASGLED